MYSVLFKALLGLGSNKTAMLDDMLAFHDEKVFRIDALIHPPEDADARNPFTSTIDDSELSIAKMTFAQRRQLAPTMLSLMRQMNHSANFYKSTFPHQTTEADATLIEEMEALGQAHGATAIRYVKVPDDCIFDGKAIPHRQAIVYTVEMDKAAIDTAPSFEAFHEVAQGYERMAVIGNHLTRLLRKHGHAAYPGTALGGLTDYSRLAELAGLGTIGYHGLLISPKEGALLRLNTIYTSIENLPYEHANDTSWVRDFCAMCGKCVRSCPPKAIHEQPINLDNGRVQCIETSACLDFFAANFGCAICIDVCPFSQKGYDVIQKRFRGNDSAPQYTITPYLDDAV